MVLERYENIWNSAWEKWEADACLHQEFIDDSPSFNEVLFYALLKHLYLFVLHVLRMSKLGQIYQWIYLSVKCTLQTN